MVSCFTSMDNKSNVRQHAPDRRPGYWRWQKVHTDRDRYQYNMYFTEVYWKTPSNELIMCCLLASDNACIWVCVVIKCPKCQFKKFITLFKGKLGGGTFMGCSVSPLLVFVHIKECTCIHWHQVCEEDDLVIRMRCVSTFQNGWVHWQVGLQDWHKAQAWDSQIVCFHPDRSVNAQSPQVTVEVCEHSHKIY